MQLKAVGTKPPYDPNYSDVVLNRNDWKVVFEDKTFQGVSRWVVWEFGNYRGEITGFVLKNDAGLIVYEKTFEEATYIGNNGDYVKVRGKIRINL